MALPLIGIAARAVVGGAARKGFKGTAPFNISTRTTIQKAGPDMLDYIAGYSRRIQNQTRKQIRMDTPVVTGKAKAGWKNRKTPNKSDISFTISNTVPYIGAINEGHSKGKKGYVEKAIKRTKV